MIEVILDSKTTIEEVHGFQGRASFSKVIFSSDIPIEPYTTAYCVYSKETKTTEFKPWADISAAELRDLFMQFC
jgi:hypothetical protein